MGRRYKAREAARAIARRHGIRVCYLKEEKMRKRQNVKSLRMSEHFHCFTLQSNSLFPLTQLHHTVYSAAYQLFEVESYEIR